MNSDINYIIQKSLKGDKIYQEKLLKRLNPLIFKNIYLYYNPSDPIVEDLLQEGYIVILESLKDYDPKRNVHFLQYIKVKICYFYKNLQRNRDNNKVLSIEQLMEKGKEIESKDFSPLDKLILKEEKDKIFNCLKGLSEIEQSIIYLFYFKKHSLKDISHKLDLNYRLVLNTKSNAVKKLKKMMLN